MARGDRSVEFFDATDAAGIEDEARPRPRRRLLSGLGAVAVAAALTAGILSSGGRHGRPPARPSNTPRGSAALPVTPQSRPVMVQGLGAILPAAAAGADVFARGPGFVLRLDLAHRVVTRTLVPALRTTGGVSFVPLTSAVLIRPLDRVLGYTVAGLAAPRVPSGALALSGPAWPAAGVGEVWADIAGRVALVGPSGRVLRPIIPVPLGASPLGGWPDGRGYLIFETLYGWYDARPDRTVQITTGNLIAVGPTRYLVSECRADACSEEVVDRRTGRRTDLGVPPGVVGVPGVIAPNGTVAAWVDPRSSLLVLTDLTSGWDTTVPLRPAADPQSIAWAPDSRELFVAERSGRLCAVDGRTAHVVDLSRVAGGPVLQVAVRPATGP